MNEKQRKLEVVCRKASSQDTPAVMELTRQIWDGDDYIPEVWQDWLADPCGQLAVAEYLGQVVGLGKLTLLHPGSWWLEGLRVDPAYEGRGVATQLETYLMADWLKHGDGMIRLGTASTRTAVHRLCAHSGFEKVGEFTTFAAAALDGTPSFRPLTGDDVPAAVEFSLAAGSLQFSWGLMDLSWQWTEPAASHLAQAVQRGQAWWWREKKGVLCLIRDIDDKEGGRPVIQLAACRQEDIGELLQDYRRLAGGLGFQKAAWLAPVHAGLFSQLESAGFVREWDMSLWIFARKHPSAGGVLRA